MVHQQNQSTFRDNIQAYVRGLGQLGQQKQQYQSKVPAGGESHYDIWGDGNCFWQLPSGEIIASRTQKFWATSKLGRSTDLSWSQIRTLFGDAAVAVVDPTTGATGWYIGRDYRTGLFVATLCHAVDLGVTGFNVATPDGGLVAVPPGAFKKGMAWDDLVQVVPSTTPANTNPSSLATAAAAAAAQAMTCSPGFQKPPPGGHITCLPSYGWVADSAGCEQCQPLCSAATGWLTQDQAPARCPPGEQLVVDPRTQCVKCMRGSNCFKQGESAVPCSAPFALEDRGEYKCCVAPTGGQQTGQQTGQQQQTQSTPATATPATVTTADVNAPMSTGAKVAIGAAVLLAAGLLFGKGK